MRKTRAAGYRDTPAGVEILGALAFFIVCSGMAWVAFSERMISTGGPRGGQILHFTGNNALFFGAFMLLAALAALGWLCRYSRYCRLYWLALALTWLGGCLGIYVSA